MPKYNSQKYPRRDYFFCKSNQLQLFKKKSKKDRLFCNLRYSLSSITRKFLSGMAGGMSFFGGGVGSGFGEGVGNCFGEGVGNCFGEGVGNGFGEGVDTGFGGVGRFAMDEKKEGES